MAFDIEKLARRRAQTSFISTIVGIALVLSLLGMMAWVMISAKDLARKAKENIFIDINFGELAKEADIIQFEKTLKAQPYVRIAHYVTKEEALETLKKLNKDDFESDSILFEHDNFNPLLPHIELHINEAYANVAAVKKIEDQLMAENQGLLDSVTYNPDMFRDVNASVNKIAIVLLSLSALLAIVAIALINNTIRLAIYSKRFLIRSMQLVGATERFIRKPYIVRSIIQGVIAGVIALGIIILSLYAISNWNMDIKEFTDFNTLLIIFGGITAGGILISWISTYFALRKYLRIQTDLLY
ncbi:MAG TPA: permease-like cell division protein FtsX [Flavobacteriales bacterium]|nr:permease-like cell division protein FtsX [Flavobacteriales bacterium]